MVFVSNRAKAQKGNKNACKDGKVGTKDVLTAADVLSALGSARPDTSAADEPSKAAKAWIQCGRCGKWRVWRTTRDLPEGEWFCNLNEDTAHNSCAAAEEVCVETEWVEHSIVPDLGTGWVKETRRRSGGRASSVYISPLGDRFTSQVQAQAKTTELAATAAERDAC